MRFKVPAFKIGSGECNNFHFVKYLCKFKIPIIMSTGMNSISSIRKSVNIILKQNSPCTSSLYKYLSYSFEIGEIRLY